MHFIAIVVVVWLVGWCLISFEATQIISHLPQLAECYQLRTTVGVSLISQHINFVGGLAGVYMCFLLKTNASTTLLYLNSIFQAVSIYLLALIFW